MMPQKQMHKNAAKRLGATTDVVSITYGVHHSEITPLELMAHGLAIMRLGVTSFPKGMGVLEGQLRKYLTLFGSPGKCLRVGDPSKEELQRSE